VENHVANHLPNFSILDHANSSVDTKTMHDGKRLRLDGDATILVALDHYLQQQNHAETANSVVYCKQNIIKLIFFHPFSGHDLS